MGRWLQGFAPFQPQDSSFWFIPKVLDHADVRALCRPVKFFHTKHLGDLFLTDLVLLHDGTVMSKQERSFSPNCCRRSWKHSIKTLYAAASRFSWVWTEALGSHNEKLHVVVLYIISSILKKLKDGVALCSHYWDKIFVFDLIHQGFLIINVVLTNIDNNK